MMRTAWLARVLWGVAVALSLAAVALAAGSSGDLRYVLEVTLLLALPWPTVGLLIATRRPRNPIGWLFIAVGVFQAVNIFLNAWESWTAAAGRENEVLLWLSGWTWAPGLALLVTFPLLLFPDGHLPSPRWRPVGWFAGLAITGTVVCLAAGLWPLRRAGGAESDFMTVSPFLRAVLPVALAAVGLAALACLLSLVGRFRRSAGVERQQLRWFVYGGALSLTALASLILIGEVPGLQLLLLALPTAIGVAVLRYRLYEIDRIISRTVTYAVVTALLLALYAVVAVLPSTLFDLESDLLVAAATLAAAAAFGPARRRVQAVVDRRFNRARYDAARVVEGFAGRLRGETSLDELITDLSRVVGAAVQPVHLSLWLRRPRAS